jgi:hypothetical protein
MHFPNALATCGMLAVMTTNGLAGKLPDSDYGV